MTDSVAKKSSGPLLEVDDLRVDFTTPAGSLRAVDGLTFAVEQGKTMGVVGESGSGKSVVARTVMAILAANGTPSGSIRFEGRELIGLPKRQARGLYGNDIAMVFQDPMTSLNPVKRIGAQITETLRFHKGMSRSASKQVALDLLTQVEIPSASSRLRSYPHELSGGMRQRVVIAMALACEPKLLIADEPTTALDVTVQRHILNLLDDLRRDRQMAMILITHDLGVAKGRCDDITVMYAGRVLEQAPSQQLFAQMHHPYTEALLKSIPEIDQPSHTRLTPIPGRPPNLLTPPVGCRFAPRCWYAQPKCVEEDPELVTALSAEHVHACHFPVGTPRGIKAFEDNEAAGVTATGLPFGDEKALVS